MTITPLVAFGGVKESGKNASAELLEQHHGYVVLNMSDALLEALTILDPWIPVNAHPSFDWAGAETGTFLRFSALLDKVGYTESKTNPEVRRLLQALGTEVGRKLIDEDVWVDIMHDKIVDHLDAGTPVAVTGIRYPNEITLIQSLDGVTIWVERAEATARAEAAATATEQHDSERSLSMDDFAYVLENDGDIENDLRKRVDAIAEAMR